MKLPADVQYNDVLIRASGNRELLIENYKGILLYTAEEIVITCKGLSLRICGCDLKIAYFSGYDMKVTGNVRSISYRSNGDVCC